MATKDVKIPDLGGAKDVDVIDILVREGDKVEKEESLITVEGEKASMDVPAPFAGIVKTIKTQTGAKVNEGDLIMLLDTSEDTEPEKPTKTSESKTEGKKGERDEKKKTTSSTSLKEVHIPDLGGSKDVDVIDILVKAGDTIQKEDSLITLEGDKASMDVPSPFNGTVKEVQIKMGDKVNKGDLILTLDAEKDETTKEPIEESKTEEEKPREEKKSEEEVEKPTRPLTEGIEVHAGPAVRRIAREFGVDLKQVESTGPKGRILIEDVQKYVKDYLAGKAEVAHGVGLSVGSAPKVDFSKFGDTETQPLSKIKRLTGENTHRSWVTIPHVTQFDEADITEMEAFRQTYKNEAEKQGYKLTPIVFLMKAAVQCLKKFPTFNASLDETGESLILKKYFHIGVAVDTPKGLVVAVIRDVDQKGLLDLAKELKSISDKAREKGLSLNDMQGSCFTISSLGGIGGTAFTPIVNAPDVAILGVSKSQMKPVYQGGNFIPRLMLPLSLSYDHRVIDGAEAARFSNYLCQLLADMRQLLL